ncbi:uncharacterized protein LOC105168470 [Sesamum indicum]|uniref:Uncharacterized protein LOC105168470 n=1 Tax=Sesamum indicum TaxID=4182 RepID=A0A6I9TQE9_SESIN|nr:uncharacterized protein LOC105168470 [Sesamum indicum]
MLDHRIFILTRNYRHDKICITSTKGYSSVGRESSSKDVADIGAAEDEKDVGWLQLSIGGGGHELKQDLMSDQTSLKNDNGSSLVELELMPTSSSHSQMIRPLGPMPEFRAPRPVMNFAGFSPSYFLQQQHHQGSSSSHYFPPHQEINWAFRPIPISIAAAASSSSSSSSFSSPSPLMAAAPSASYFARPFQLYAGVDMAPVGPPGVDFRVVQPPRRPHSGVWFMLQASQNQEKEPFLPQISKSYLRIKDGRMTIRLVIKYLVNKLRLENESEIEIRCKGQRLLPFLTLQHVRDNIWSNNPRDFITLLPNSSTTHHIMVLHYGRINASN